MVLEINDKDFEQEVLKSDLPVLVDFWAEWCGPCRQIAPVIAELSQEMQGKLKIVKVNVDNNTEIATKIGVRGIPTLALFKEGKQVATKVGALPKSALADWINTTLA